VPMASQPTPMASRNWMLRRMMIEMIRNDPEWNNGNYTSQPRSLLAINSADDERNPPETGITERELKRVKNGRLYLVPASEDTRGHGTTGMARFWKRELQQLLETAPRRTM
jgi:hypothetical protein